MYQVNTMQVIWIDHISDHCLCSKIISFDVAINNDLNRITYVFPKSVVELIQKNGINK